MLTDTHIHSHAAAVSNSPSTSQDENPPTAEEIARRVLAIRASWGLQERITRRRVGEKRLSELLSLLQAA